MDTLRSFFPLAAQKRLRAALKRTDGDVTAAAELIAADDDERAAHQRKRANTPSARASKKLRGNDKGSSQAALGSSSSHGPLASSSAAPSAAPSSSRGVSTRSAFDLLLQAPAVSPTKNKGRRVPAYETSADVSKATQGLCTLVLDALPVELATTLFLHMIAHSRGKVSDSHKWERNRWHLFDRTVESPHLTTFFAEASRSGGYDDGKSIEEAARYWYNGQERPSNVFTPKLNEARAIISRIVHEHLATREVSTFVGVRDERTDRKLQRHPLEWQGEWRPNVAAANCYSGSKESVGYHSDVLTYLGPRATIASLSLGVTRCFRLRPSADTDEKETVDIVLPHNSCLIMHGGTQETFKHTVPPRHAVDLFRASRSVLYSSDEARAALGLALGSDDEVAIERQTWIERINVRPPECCAHIRR